jgi:hypothetical protein
VWKGAYLQTPAYLQQVRLDRAMWTKTKRACELRHEIGVALQSYDAGLVGRRMAVQILRNGANRYTVQRFSRRQQSTVICRCLHRDTNGLPPLIHISFFKPDGGHAWQGEAVVDVPGRDDEQDAFLRSPPIHKARERTDPASESQVLHTNGEIHNKNVGGQRIFAGDELRQSGMDQINEQPILRRPCAVVSVDKQRHADQPRILECAPVTFQVTAQNQRRHCRRMIAFIDGRKRDEIMNIFNRHTTIE